MSKRSIEETFQAVKPKWKKGIPSPPPISVGVASDNNDLSSSLSQAGQQIAQLQSAYQQQANLISANTQALQSNTSAQGSHSGTTAGSVVSNLFGGALGFVSPLISGIASLFRGSSAPAPLQYYTPPAPVNVSGIITAPTSAPAGVDVAGGLAALASSSAANGAAAPAAAQPTGSTSATQAANSPQVTVNVSAMDSQSFMDRSADIANAVREAMLNLHPINDVVASL